MKILKNASFRAGLFGAVMLGVAAVGSPSADASAEVQWRKDGPALLESKQERPVLLRFTASWCGPCRVMNSNVWPDARVVQAVNKRFIPVELDIDRPEVQALAQKFRIVAVPTIVLLDKDGREVDRANFMSSEETLRFLEQAIPE